MKNLRKPILFSKSRSLLRTSSVKYPWAPLLSASFQNQRTWVHFSVFQGSRALALALAPDVLNSILQFVWDVFSVSIFVGSLYFIIHIKLPGTFSPSPLLVPSSPYLHRGFASRISVGGCVCVFLIYYLQLPVHSSPAATSLPC